MSITKLVRYNLSKPFEQRIGYLDLLEKTETYKIRGNLMALHTQIHEEIDAAKPSVDIDNI